MEFYYGNCYITFKNNYIIHILHVNANCLPFMSVSSKVCNIAGIK